MDKLISDGDFIRISSFFKRMKILHGNDFVNVTLRNHPKLKEALLNYEKRRIIQLEGEINSKS